MEQAQKVPPSSTGSAAPRLSELAPEVFEDLCLALVRTLTDIHSADKHGKRGQADEAVDIVARRTDGRIDLFQCKRYETYSGAYLKSHVQAFLDVCDEWRCRGDIARYILIVACSTENAAVHRELEVAEALFQEQGIEIELWSSGTVVHKLGNQPQLVRRYFHEYWVDKLCSRPELARADAMLEKSNHCIQIADYESALAHAREALALALESGDKTIEHRARKAVVRNIDHIVVTGKFASDTARSNLLDEMQAHIDALEVSGASVGNVANLRALLARLRKEARNAIEFARIAYREAGDDEYTKAEALLIELQAFWQLKCPEEGLTRAEEVKTFLATLDEDVVRLPLAATWLRTLCQAGHAEASDIETFVRLVRDMVERDKTSIRYGIGLLGEVANEFGRSELLEGARTLCLVGLDLAILADEPWRAGTACLDVARVCGALDARADTRRYIGEAERWFEITRQRDLNDATHRNRWIAGMSNAFMTKGERIDRWARKDGNSIELLKEASQAYSQALALATEHGGGLPGDVTLFVGECHFRLASLALELGQYAQASAHFKEAHAPVRLANQWFRDEFGERAMLGEAEALAFGGRVVDAHSRLTEILASPTLSTERRRMAEANLAWLENSVLPVTDWYSSDAAMQLRDEVGRQGLQTVIAQQMRPLVEWLTIFPPEGERNACPELLDIWGRGGFARIATAIRAFPGRAITVSASSVDEIAKWARVFCPLYDTVVVIWKGALMPALAMIPMPDNLGPPGEFGGQGYIRTGTEIEGLDEFHVAFGWANFLPKDVALFLCTQALPLIRSGRLVVLPGPLVGCTQSAIGWTDNLLVDGAFGGVVTVAGLAGNEGNPERTGRLLDLATARIPYVEGISLADLDTMLGEMSEWLTPLRRMLRTSISGSPLRQERWEQLGPCFDDIFDACRQLEERWRNLTKSSAGREWRVEAVTSAFSAGERSADTIGKDSVTDFLRATTTQSPDIEPWVPFWRLTQAGGRIDWTRPLDNPSTPPDELAMMSGVRNPIAQSWLYPGDGGPGMATGFMIGK